MEKDLMIPLSYYANCIRNIGEKQPVDLTEKKFQAAFLLKMGIYWGRTYVTNQSKFWFKFRLWKT